VRAAIDRVNQCRPLGDREGPPVRLRGRGLHHRERGNDAEHEDPAATSLEHLGGQTFDPPVGPVGYPRQIDPLRQPFPTSDGWISIVIYTHDAWDRAFALLGDPAFIAQEKYNVPGGRGRHQAELYAHMAALTPAFTMADLLEKCHAAQLPAQPARDLSEVIDDPHLNATGFFRKREHPSEGTYLEQAAPVRFGAQGPRDPAMPPQLDDDGAAIRAELAALRKGS
jgi:crotonobetainyl-CoA:carnitine CoA-transferase CaiB-like acyl-CoA transferase